MRTSSATRGDQGRAASARGAGSTAPSRSAMTAGTASPRTPEADGLWELEMENEWIEAEAFSSVHDLVHHAILSQPGGCASLRQIYDTCERQGRIAYKRSGGSRIITANEHWKSQIRHALYTSPRFCRAPNLDDTWCVARGHDDKPATTTVRVNLSAAGATPSCVLPAMPIASASGRKRPSAAMANSAATPRSTSSNRLRGKNAGEPAPSSASAAGGRRRQGGGKAAATNARGRLFTAQATPEPPTPDVLGAEVLARGNRGGVKPSTSSCSAAPPKKRHKTNGRGNEQEDAEDAGAQLLESFRDPSRNRRKPAKAPGAAFGSLVVAAPEPQPTPRDASRNRRKGKAARAADGDPLSGAGPVLESKILGLRAKLDVATGATGTGSDFNSEASGFVGVEEHKMVVKVDM